MVTVDSTADLHITMYDWGFAEVKTSQSLADITEDS